MKHVLILGNGPLLSETNPANAAVLRTQQFLAPLREKYAITLVVITSQEVPAKTHDREQFEIFRQDPDLHSKIRQIAHSQEFDAAIGINTFPSFLAAREIPENLPFWADLNGWIMAEMQVQSFELGHNTYLARGWEQERAILLRADMISTVSAPQKYAVWGELAALGRLNREHFPVDFVQVIPNAAFKSKVSELPTPNPELKRTFRGAIIPENAFVVTQIGGFNNWVDEQTLFEGLEKAMAVDQNIHFLSTGGKIEYVAEKPFARFQKRVENSPYSERFHLLGWIDPKLIPQVYAESNLGVMADVSCPETITGARNRLNEMMAYGLPFVATKGSEVSFDAATWGCGQIVESGQPELLAEAVLRLKDNAAELERMSQKALEASATFLTPERTTTPLQNWLKEVELPLLHNSRTVLAAENWQRRARMAWQFGRERGVKALFQKVRQYLRAGKARKKSEKKV